MFGVDARVEQVEVVVEPTREAVVVAVSVAAGAACHAKSTSVSAVLQAMAVPHEYAVGTLRLSTGRHTSMEEVERAAALIIEQAKLQRGASK